MVNISDLKPLEKNLFKSRGDKQIELIGKSIQDFKEMMSLRPIIVDEDFNILGGNKRFYALKMLGYVDLPSNWVKMATGLSEEQKREFIVKDNAHWGSEWDLDLLKDWKIDLEGFGVDVDFELLSLSEDDVEEVEADNPEDVKTDIQEGDVFQIGRHRLMCGDSTDFELVKNKLCDGKIMNMMFTDPPYLMGFEGNIHADGSKSQNARFGKIINDKMSKEEGQRFINKIFEVSKELVIGSYYVCFYRLGLHYIFNALQENDLQYKSLIIWNKGNHTLSNSDYMSKYEPIVYGWFKEHKFYGDRSNFDIWDIQGTQKNDLHPTMKPIELCAKAVSNSSEQNGLVLDLFGGSGSTMVACEQLNRSCFMMELDAHYCQVIINRMRKLNPGIEVKCLNREVKL